MHGGVQHTSPSQMPRIAAGPRPWPSSVPSPFRSSTKTQLGSPEYRNSSRPCWEAILGHSQRCRCSYLRLDARDTLSDVQHILIDGLDNCDDKSRQSLLDLLVSFVNDDESGNRLKVTFSVREMAADIEEALSRCQGRAVRGSHSSDPSKTVMRDWASRILAETCYPSSPEPHVFQALEKCKSNTDLIFTVHSLRCLDSTECSKTMHLMESLTRTLPPPIEPLITARFTSLQTWSRCALGWILNARRPMKVTELTTAVALTAGAVVVDERHLPLNQRWR